MTKIRKPKFEIGQHVYAERNTYYDFKSVSGTITAIKLNQQINESKSGAVSSTKIVYTIKSDNGMGYSFEEKELSRTKSALYLKKRKAEKSKAKRALTRAEKALAKNEGKLVELQKQLKGIKK